MIPYQPVDPDDQPSRAELGESREDTRDYHDGPPPADLATAVRAWLRFDNEVQPPAHDAPYADHLAYETAKSEITERVAGALPDPEIARLFWTMTDPPTGPARIPF